MEEKKEGKKVKLRNGKEEIESLVWSTGTSLKELLKKKPMALYHLVMKCRDHNYQLTDKVAEYLKSQDLILQDGTVHDSIKNIVLSTVVGEGINMELVSPLAQ